MKDYKQFCKLNLEEIRFLKYYVEFLRKSMIQHDNPMTIDFMILLIERTEEYLLDKKSKECNPEWVRKNKTGE